MADKPVNPLLGIHQQQVNRPQPPAPMSLEALKAKAAALKAGTQPTAPKPVEPTPAPAPSTPPKLAIPFVLPGGVKPTAVAPTPAPAKVSPSLAPSMSHAELQQAMSEVKPKPQLPTIVQQNTPVVYTEHEEGAPKETRFKIILDNLDKAMSTQFGVDMVTIDTIRGFIKEVFQDLQREPELDALLIDRDVHNIIRFIRSVKGMAVEAQVEKKVKTKAKSEKKLAQEKLFANVKIPKMPGMPDFSDL